MSQTKAIQYYDFKPFVQGATRKKTMFTFQGMGTPEPPVIRFTLKTHPEGPIEYVFSNEIGNEKIELVEHIENIVFEIKEQIINIPAFDYMYGLEIQFNDENGTIYKPLKGKFPIKSAINNSSDG